MGKQIAMDGDDNLRMKCAGSFYTEVNGGQMANGMSSSVQRDAGWI